MIKKMYLLATLCLASILVKAQPGNFVFSVTQNVPYQNLTTPTVITTTGWDDFDAQVPLGFMYKLMDDSTNTIYFESNDMNVGGDMQFNTSANSTNPFSAITFLYDLVDRYSLDSINHSQVGYKTDVVNGKKITKIEWNNAGLLDGLSINDSLNVQSWFYEADNSFEYRIGNCSREDLLANITDPNIYGFKGPMFLFVKKLNILATNPTAENLYFPSSLSPATMDSSDLMTMFTNPSNFGIDSFPKPNTLLRWGPAVNTGVNTIALNNNISIYPTIITNEMTLNFNTHFNYNASIYNLNGQLVLSKKINTSTETISMKNCVAGNYILVLNNDTEKIVYKITKQ